MRDISIQEQKEEIERLKKINPQYVEISYNYENFWGYKNHYSDPEKIN